MFRKFLSQKAIDQARDSGAADIVTKVSRDIKKAKTEAREMFVEAILTVEASGRPRIHIRFSSHHSQPCVFSSITCKFYLFLSLSKSAFIVIRGFIKTLVAGNTMLILAVVLIFWEYWVSTRIT